MFFYIKKNFVSKKMFLILFLLLLFLLINYFIFDLKQNGNQSLVAKFSLVLRNFRYCCENPHYFASKFCFAHNFFIQTPF